MWTKMPDKRARLAIWLAAATLLTALAIPLLQPGAPRQIPIFLLLWIWPAVTWSLLTTGDVFERLLVGAGLAILLNALFALLASYLPGATPLAVLLLGALSIALIPLALLIVLLPGSSPQNRPERRETLLVGAILLLALVVRFANVGHKELQGDEGVIMVRAAASLTGDDGEIFLHQKGPIEIMIPFAAWGIGGAIDDFWARLPFTWAGWLSVVAIYWLTRRWFGRSAGLAALVFFTIGGFGVAFSRIIQYQMLVVLWSALALIAASRYREKGWAPDLWLTALFISGSILAHYDGLLFVPAAAWLLAGRVYQAGRPDWRAWGPGLLVGAAVLAVFYLPYVLNPNFGRTVGYLLGVRVGAVPGRSTVGWGGPSVWQMFSFYNSIWYVIALLALTLAGCWRLLKQKSDFAAFLYFVVPLLFYLFVVADARTHVYTLAPGASVLGGLGAAYAWSRLRKRGRAAQAVAAAVTIGWLVVATAYPILLFVDSTTERQRNWQESRPSPALYPTTWRDPPQYGLFGFPHQAGWRAVPQLLSDDSFPYASNEEEEITNWYLSQAPRTHCPDLITFIEAGDAQDQIPYDPNWLEERFLHGRVLVNGRETMAVYGMEPPAEVQIIEAGDARRWMTPSEIRPPRFAGENHVGVVLGDQVRLLGYDLDARNAEPGGSLVVTLYWEALAPMSRNKQVFVHLFDGVLWAQHDGAPECDINPTTRWEPGQIIPDSHIVSLPENMPTGPMPLLVGMYDLLSGERLLPPNGADGAVHLKDVEVRGNQ
jgi:4-amino-4-deoxy-L-arabinose transferase-like glycosyltransferase